MHVHGVGARARTEKRRAASTDLPSDGEIVVKSSSFHSGALQIIVCRNEVLQPDRRHENLTVGQFLKKRQSAKVGKCVLLFLNITWIWGIDGPAVRKQAQSDDDRMRRRPITSLTFSNILHTKRPAQPEQPNPSQPGSLHAGCCD